MKLLLNNDQYIETSVGFDLSIPLRAGANNVNAWYVKPIKIEPVINSEFIGDVNQGGAVNFRDIYLNPHGNGTHTECVGHISKEDFTINQCLKEFHFLAKLITVEPESIFNPDYKQKDLIITKAILQRQIKNWGEESALIIRTIPNSDEKLNHQYSSSNPPYFTKEAIEFINDLGVQHLMVDLPSVDREVDNGQLIAHKTFWNYPKNPLKSKTISELLYVPDFVVDNTYFVQIQIMSIESDASPSKIMAHEIFQR